MFLKSIYLTLIMASMAEYTMGCSMTEDQLDECFYNSMFFGSKDAIVPGNDAELDQHCSIIREGSKCIKNYADTCLEQNSFPQKVVQLMYTNIGHHMDNRCNKPSERTEFLENIQCFLPKEKMDPLHVCSDKLTKFVELTSQMNKDEPHLPFICCGFQEYRHCIVSNTEKICTVGHSQFWDEIFDEMSMEAITYACSNYETYEKCHKNLYPEGLAKITAIMEATDPAVWHHGFKTPVKFFLDMIRKFY